MCPTLRHGQDQRLDEGLYIGDVQQDLVEYVLLRGEVRQRMYGTTRTGTSAEERRERERPKDQKGNVKKKETTTQTSTRVLRGNLQEDEQKNMRKELRLEYATQ